MGGKICAIIVFLLALGGNPVLADNLIFDAVNNDYDTKGIYVRTIAQLPDGRMVFVSINGLDLYDGYRYKNLPAFPSEYTIPLSSYSGFHHLYLEGDSLLWLKDWGKVACVDLRTESYRDISGFNIDDVYFDNNGHRIVLSGDSLRSDNFVLPLSMLAGTLQDVAEENGTLYLFDNSGRVTAVSMDNGEKIYHADAYPEDMRDSFRNTSLVCIADDGFYQIRNGNRGGVLQYFSTEKRKWTSILETPYSLNTLVISKDHKAYVSCQRGLWNINLKNGDKEYQASLRTSKGNLLATEISTVYEDPAGCLWLGTFNRGVLYYNPKRYTSQVIPLDSVNPGFKGNNGYFAESRDGSVYYCSGNNALELNADPFTDKSQQIVDVDIVHTISTTDKSFVSSDGSVYFKENEGIMFFSPNKPLNNRSLSHRPILTSIYIHGERIIPGNDYDGNVILPYSEAVTDCIELSHNQNFISFEYATLNYLDNDTLNLSYRLTGLDPYTVHMMLPPGENRYFKINYTNLPPGEYVLTAGVDDESARLKIIINPPWWRTTWAYMVYVVLFIAILLLGGYIYYRISQRRMQRKLREDMLLARIRSLIDQCKAYEHDVTPSARETASIREEKNSPENGFISKAVEFVEKNINTPGYSVEQLSRDLCMDRTGLYRKLMLLLDQSPSLFIRNIRLQHAARLLLENQTLSIAEIAEMTGFSSGSYMSKCFQEMYGCRPSEYALKSTEST